LDAGRPPGRREVAGHDLPSWRRQLLRSTI
jgi:hypothetical protein